MAKTSKIVVRKATLEDYQAVLDINKDVYKGADYVILYYKDLITDPDSSYYVCEVDGEVGAFEGVCLIDDNNTLMARAARVKDKFQGQGLLRYIRKQIYEDYKDVPGQKRLRTCCTNMVRLVNSDRFHSQNKTLAMKSLFTYDFLENFSISSPFCDIIPEVTGLDVDDLPLLLENKEIVDYLFPEGYVSIIAWFFDPLVSNIRHIKKLFPYISISAALKESVQRLTPSRKIHHEDPEAFHSKGNDQQTSGRKNDDIGENHRPQGMMALSGHYFSPNVFHYVIDIYGEPAVGREEEEIRSLVFHTLKHASELMSKNDPKVPVMLGFSAKYGTSIDVYQKILSPLGFKQDDVAGPGQYKDHYYFEQSFDQLLTG